MDGARLDVSTRGFWTDVRVIHPQARSNAGTSLFQMYRKHEIENKNKYNDRILQVEKATFTPLVISTTGGMGSEQWNQPGSSNAQPKKSGQTHSDTVAFIRRRLRFDLLKTCVISLRGFRGKINAKTTEMGSLDLNLNIIILFYF